MLLLDGQAEPGRKILISGGGRCNVTNEVAEPHDFTTTSPRALRTQLLELPPTALARFFADAGVPLQVEPLGKLFPPTAAEHATCSARRTSGWTMPGCPSGSARR